MLARLGMLSLVPPAVEPTIEVLVDEPLASGKRGHVSHKSDNVSTRKRLLPCELFGNAVESDSTCGLISMDCAHGDERRTRAW